MSLYLQKIVYPSMYAAFRALGVAAWFQADWMLTGLAAVANGSLLSSWPDISGNGNNAGATSTARPTFQTAQLNALPGVVFDGAANVMVTEAFSLSQPFALFVVATPPASGDPVIIDGLSAYTFFQPNMPSSGDVEINAGTALSESAHSGLGAPAVFGAVFDGSTSLISFNGYTATGAAGSSNAGGLTLGNAYTGSSFYSGPIFEALAIPIPNGLSTANRQLLEGYLAWKWGVASSLVSSHPYYSVAPFTILNFQYPLLNLAVYDGEPVAFHARSNYGTHWDVLSRVDHYEKFDMPFIQSGSDSAAWGAFLGWAASGADFDFYPAVANQAAFTTCFTTGGRRALARRSLGMYKLDQFEMTQTIF